MSSPGFVLDSLRKAAPALRRRYPIQSLALFGSYARADAVESSDVDILVAFSEPVSLSTFLALEDELATVTGHRVDLVSQESLKPHIKRHVTRDMVPV